MLMILISKQQILLAADLLKDEKIRLQFNCLALLLQKLEIIMIAMMMKIKQRKKLRIL
jgi:type IV secretory pathway component VirB8